MKNDSDRENIKQYLRKIYKLYKQCYKHFASFQPIGDVWALQILSFFEVANVMNIIDGVVLEADVNIKWVSTMSGNPKGNQRMPERGMCRYSNYTVGVSC